MNRTISRTSHKKKNPPAMATVMKVDSLVVKATARMPAISAGCQTFGRTRKRQTATNRARSMQVM